MKNPKNSESQDPISQFSGGKIPNRKIQFRRTAIPKAAKRRSSPKRTVKIQHHTFRPEEERLDEQRNIFFEVRDGIHAAVEEWELSEEELAEEAA